MGAHTTPDNGRRFSCNGLILRRQNGHTSTMSAAPRRGWPLHNAGRAAYLGPAGGVPGDHRPGVRAVPVHCRADACRCTRPTTSTPSAPSLGLSGTGRVSGFGGLNSTGSPVGRATTKHTKIKRSTTTGNAATRFDHVLTALYQPGRICDLSLNTASGCTTMLMKRRALSEVDPAEAGELWHIRMCGISG